MGLVLQDSTRKYYVPWDKIITEIPMEVGMPFHEKLQAESSGHAMNLA